MSYIDIILPKKTVKASDGATADEILIDDYILTARRLLSDTKGNTKLQSEAINEICLQFVRCGESIKIEQYITDLAREFSIGKAVFKTGIQAAKSKIKSESKGDIGDDSTPLINRVMKFLAERYEIFFNEIANKFMCKVKGESHYKEMNLDNIYCELKKNHLSFSHADLKSLLKSDFIPKINVFERYFEGLPSWDGTDYIGALAKYIKIHIPPGSNEQDRFNRMFRKMLVRTVACSLNAAFNKQCFTLVHEKQNSGKSTFLRWLCPLALEEYYAEGIGTSKDDLIALTENFLINIDELSTLSKQDINGLKSVMSKDKVKVRLPYGERAELLQRRCSFVASTNRMEFLNDETGSVRWVCFLLKEINWDYKREIDVDLVWSQAYHLFRESNFDYQLSPEEIQENEQANRTFLIRSPEMELIQKYLVSSSQDEYKEQGVYGLIKFMTSTDILTFIQSKSQGAIKLIPTNVGKSLALLGFAVESMYFKNMKMSVKGYYVQERDGSDEYANGESNITESAQLDLERKDESYQARLPY
jgi:hypothetical protein